MKLSVFLLGLLLIVNTVIRAQNLPVDKETKLITYKAVVNQKGSADELYERAMSWFKKFYKNPTEVVREKDKENAKIKGIARLQLYFIDKDDKKEVKQPKGMIEYTITIEAKDDRFRYTITNLNLKQASYFPLERWLDEEDPQYSDKNSDYLFQIQEYMQNLIKDLKDGMKPVVEKKDVW